MTGAADGLSVVATLGVMVGLDVSGAFVGVLVGLDVSGEIVGV